MPKLPCSRPNLEAPGWCGCVTMLFVGLLAPEVCLKVSSISSRVKDTYMPRCSRLFQPPGKYFRLVVHSDRIPWAYGQASTFSCLYI